MGDEFACTVQMVQADGAARLIPASGALQAWAHFGRPNRSAGRFCTNARYPRGSKPPSASRPPDFRSHAEDPENASFGVVGANLPTPSPGANCWVRPDVRLCGFTSGSPNSDEPANRFVGRQQSANRPVTFFRSNRFIHLKPAAMHHCRRLQPKAEDQ